MRRRRSRSRRRRRRRFTGIAADRSVGRTNRRVPPGSGATGRPPPPTPVPHRTRGAAAPGLGGDRAAAPSRAVARGPHPGHRTTRAPVRGWQPRRARRGRRCPWCPCHRTTFDREARSPGVSKAPASSPTRLSASARSAARGARHTCSRPGAAARTRDTLALPYQFVPVSGFARSVRRLPDGSAGVAVAPSQAIVSSERRGGSVSRRSVGGGGARTTLHVRPLGRKSSIWMRSAYPSNHPSTLSVVLTDRIMVIDW